MPRPNVPDPLIEAFVTDPIVHAVFELGAQRGLDERETLIMLVVELVRAKKEVIDAHVEHLQQCPVLRLPTV